LLKINAEKLAAVINGKLYGANKKSSGVSTDTRNLSGTEVFFALQGEKSDGHNYINPNLNASVVVVEREVNFPSYIVVENTLNALGKLAAFYREQFNPVVFGITGSNGKTTTKEMLSSILNLEAPTLATSGNFNNEIGLPLTVFQLTDEYEYAVLEMGMRGRGQIEYLANIAKPKIGIVTCIGEVHAELLGSRDNIAKAKGELLQALPADGFGIIPLSSDYYNFLKELTKKVVSFGPGGDVYAEDISFDSEGKASFTLCYQDKNLPIYLSLPGEHNINNALAAAAAAIVVGVPLEKIKAGLEKQINLQQRLKEITRGDLVVIDDTYNASPTSMKAALKHLYSRATALGLTAYAALGDMKELGEESEKYHLEIIKYAYELGLGNIYLLGEEMAKAHIEAEKAGYKTELFLTHEAIANKVSSCKGILLLKGSRSMEMEQVLNYLKK